MGKKSLLFLITIFIMIFSFGLVACDNQPAVSEYYLDSNGNLVAEFEDGSTKDLGTLGDTIANGVVEIEINSDGFYVINDIVTEIQAKLPESYAIDTNGNLIVTYTDTTTENLGKFGNDAINTIDTISISDDGFYVLNGIKTDIVAVEVYDVTFNTGFSTNVSKQTIKDGNKVVRPEIERKGYTLNGWYCNGEEWRFNSDVVKNDMVLTADWTANEYTVSFVTGTDTVEDSTTVIYDSEYVLPELEQAGYTFDGWLHNGKLVTANKWSIAEDCTLTAKWTVNKYTVTLNANGGSVSPASKQIEYGKSFTLPIPTNDFGIFKGWYYGDVKFTDEQGNSLQVWSYTENIEVSTNWITEIRTVSDLSSIKNALNGYYVLMNNIDLSTTQWVPLGATPESLNGLTADNFTGVIEGNNYTISGLKMTSYMEQLSAYGLVGYNYGTIKNLNLTNVNISLTRITKDIYAGGICGYNRGTIDNCTVEGTISVSNHSGSYDSHTGGVAGAVVSLSINNEAYSPSIINCTNNANVTSNTYAGGIVGFSMHSAASYQKCINNGAIYSPNIAGGIVAYSYGDTFNKCKNTGTVQGNKESGGILGATVQDSFFSSISTFNQCVNTGNIQTSNSIECEAGGIAGDIYCGNITDCYNTGEIKGHRVGGILGHSYWIGTTISNTYNIGKISGNQYSAGILGCGTQVEIIDSINFGTISTSIAKGYISGFNYSGSHSNCYYKKASGTYEDSETAGISSIVLEISDITLYANTLYWSVMGLNNTDGIWFIDGTNAPKLAWEIAL